MNADQLRALALYTSDQSELKFWLSEIAVQLAEMNERQSEGQKLGEEVARKSLTMMERTEKELSK